MLNCKSFDIICTLSYRFYSLSYSQHCSTEKFTKHLLLEELMLSIDWKITFMPLCTHALIIFHMYIYIYIFFFFKIYTACSKQQFLRSLQMQIKKGDLYFFIDIHCNSENTFIENHALSKALIPCLPLQVLVCFDAMCAKW